MIMILIDYDSDITIGVVVRHKATQKELLGARTGDRVNQIHTQQECGLGDGTFVFQQVRVQALGWR